MIANLSIAGTLDTTQRHRLLVSHLTELIKTGQQERALGIIEAIRSFDSSAWNEIANAHGRHVQAILLGATDVRPLDLFLVGDYDNKLMYLARHVVALFHLQRYERIRGLLEVTTNFSYGATGRLLELYGSQIATVMRSDPAPLAK